MRCLIIDDDESPRALMLRLIKDAGHRAVAVRSGTEAVAAVRREQFDVAIVDLEMPGMTGTETIAHLRSAAETMRVLVVSGHDDRRRVLAAFEAGADGYLVKDELADGLTRSLQEVRAGNSPLSPRIASVVLRQLRRAPTGPMLASASAAVAKVGLASGSARMRANRLDGDDDQG